MQIIENIALISINETLFVQLISFLIFMFIMNRLMFRPLRDTMIERDMYISGIKNDIVEAEKELDNIKRQLKKQEELTRKEANELRKELENMGSQRASEIFVSAREEITDLKLETEKEVETMITEARKYIKEESESLAADIMEKILDRRLLS
ncbi:MAG: ATP synthase F0 subunit B [Desulfobacteraceae bacterium]|nr:ATP synthase F0 subunit B [Desulfobacteraceae bacterium]